MIISKTPYRISFLGGGTDHKEWFKKNGGCFLSTAIDKYSYIFLNKNYKFFDFNYRFLYSKTEELKDYKSSNHVSIKSCLEYFKIKKPITISHLGDMPSGSGLATSSAFTVGLVNALAYFNKRKISQSDLYKISTYIEQEKNKEKVGIQDQIATSVGNLNFVTISKSGEVKINKVNMPKNKRKLLEENLIILFSNTRRSSTEVETTKNFNHPSLQELCDLTYFAKNLLISKNDKDLDEFAKLISKSWEIKKSLSNIVSNSYLDEIYDLAMKSGALGGKLLGSGAGGWFLFYVKKANQDYFFKKLKNFNIVKINFCRKGSELIYKSF